MSVPLFLFITDFVLLLVILVFVQGHYICREQNVFKFIAMIIVDCDKI